MTEVLLIHGYLVPKLHGGYKDGDLDTDMALCKRAREKVTNVGGLGSRVYFVIIQRLHSFRISELLSPPFVMAWHLYDMLRVKQPVCQITIVI